jgi:hypothetical protein
VLQASQIEPPSVATRLNVRGLNFVPLDLLRHPKGRALMRMTFVCALLATVLTAMPASAGKRTWDFVKSDAGKPDSDVLLVYGVPESEDVTLSFICKPKQKKITVVSTVLPANARLGRAGKVKLANGTSSLEYSGKVGQDNEDSGLHFSATTTIQPRLFDLLEKGTSIRVESFGASENVPLAGIRKSLARMRQVCR